MNNNIKVFIKEPGKTMYETIIPNTLEALQDTVGGYIEVVPTDWDWVIICNEEGKINGLPDNLYLYGEYYHGTVIFVGVDGEEFTDIPYDMADFLGLTYNLSGGNR